MSNFRDWWKKQNFTFKGAVISGAFLLIATLCGGLISFFNDLYINTQLLDKAETPNIQIILDNIRSNSYNGDEFGLFATTHEFDKKGFHIVSASCLDFQFKDDNFQFSWDNKYFTGKLKIGVTTNVPILLEKLELVVLAFSPITSTNYIVNFFWIPGLGTGGEPIKEITLEEITIDQNLHNGIDLLNTTYQFTSEDALNFIVPIASNGLCEFKRLTKRGIFSKIMVPKPNPGE